MNPNYFRDKTYKQQTEHLDACSLRAGNSDRFRRYRNALYLFVLGFFLSTGFAQRLGPIPPGQDAWLFHQDEFGFYEQADPESIVKALEHIATLSNLFRERDIELFVAITPSKISVLEDYLPEGIALTESLKNRYAKSLDYLQSQNVNVIDLKSAFESSPDLNAEFPIFQRLDHHWSATGAILAAETIAQAIQTKASDALESIPTVEYTRTEEGIGTYLDSSLLKLVSEDERKALSAQGQVPERYKQYSFERLTENTAGLFSQDTPEVVLVGSSFSQGEPGGSWPFHSALQQALSKEVLNVSQVGKGPWQPLSDYLYDEAYQKSPPKIIVWEFWELFLETFGQANLRPEWLIHTSMNILGSCDVSLGQIDKVRSNGTLNSQANLNLLSPQKDTYLEFILDNEPSLSDYFTAKMTFSEAEAADLRFEVLGDTWQRLHSIPVKASSLSDYLLQVPLYGEAGSTASKLRIYPGEMAAFDISDTRLCSAPSYIADPLMKPLDFTESNLGITEVAASLATAGLRGVEQNYGRWALGPESEASFWLDEDQPLSLALAFNNPVADQSLELSYNGKLLESFESLAKDSFTKRTYSIEGKKGLNRLNLSYGLWNQQENQFIDDPTPFAIFVQTLGIFPKGQAEFTPSDNREVVTDFTQDLVFNEAPEGFRLDGFSVLEEGGLRWALGPETRILFDVDTAKQLSFDLRFFNPIENQTIDLSFNGEKIDSLPNINSGAVFERVYEVLTKEGENELLIRYKDWNENNTIFAQGDSRPMAIMFSKLQIYEGLARTQVSDEPIDFQPIVETTQNRPQAILEPVSEPINQLVVLNESIDFAEGNLIQSRAPRTIQLRGVSPVEREGYRWSLGPETTADFWSDSAQSVEVNLAFFNPIDGQSLSIEFNGSVLQELKHIDQGTEMQLKFFVSAIPGNNRLTLRYSHWNGNQVIFAPEDSRPMGILFNTLELRDSL